MNFEVVATPFFIRELKWLAKRYPAIRKDIAEQISISDEDLQTRINSVDFE